MLIIMSVEINIVFPETENAIATPFDFSQS